MNIDSMSTPLERFVSALEKQEDGTYTHRFYPLGKGKAQCLMATLSRELEDAYLELVAPEESERLEEKGEVPIVRNGHKVYEDITNLSLKDLPDILDTLMVLQTEAEHREREEAERKAAARKNLERVRAKERRKLKKLGEW